MGRTLKKSVPGRLRAECPFEAGAVFFLIRKMQRWVRLN